MLASGLVLGLAAGLAVRRSWRPLLETQVRWLPVLIGSLLLRVIASMVGEGGYPLYLMAIVGTSATALINYRLAGAAIVAFGGCLNFIVVIVNHGMPVDVSAVVMVGAQMPRDSLHVVLDAGTLLAVLADVIPIALVRSVYSVGDVFIAFGAFVVPFFILVRR